jgi:hypothetical protein
MQTIGDGTMVAPPGQIQQTVEQGTEGSQQQVMVAQPQMSKFTTVLLELSNYSPRQILTVVFLATLVRPVSDGSQMQPRMRHVVVEQVTVGGQTRYIQQVQPGQQHYILRPQQSIRQIGPGQVNLTFLHYRFEYP